MSGKHHSHSPRSLLIPRLAFASLLLAAASTHGQSDIPPVDPSSTLADLAKLETAYERAMDELRKTAVNILGQAAGSPGSAGRLYEKAIAATSSGNFVEWKKRNADLLRSKPFQQAAQMHLRYLVLSLERGRSDRDSKHWAEPSLRYARDLAALLTDKDFRGAPGQGNELLGEPMAKSAFTQWLQIGPLLPPDATWEQVPGNLGGILEKNVRVPWRLIGDPRTDLAWQLELETGVILADTDGSERAAQNFNQGTAPGLLFRRATDRAATGQPNRAAADVLDLARRHPTHPDFPQWAAKLREMLGSKEETR
ncbi:MAG: hypothetical protein O3A75_06900 [Verrucomicrobia bacterium]|nr:hypothetical protein [Verrucomicrobiota bacterium]